MNDIDDGSWVQQLWSHLDPFLRAAEHYAAGNDADGAAAIEDRINAEPITEDDDQLIRAWSMISVGYVVVGAALRKHVDGPITENSFWFVQPVSGDGSAASLDETAPPEVATAVRLAVAGANQDLDMGSALIAATWEQRGADGMLLVLSSLALLYGMVRPPGKTPMCRCGHPETAHDAGQCWTYPDATATNHPDPVCSCDWYEEARS